MLHVDQAAGRRAPGARSRAWAGGALPGGNGAATSGRAGAAIDRTTITGDTYGMANAMPVERDPAASRRQAVPGKYEFAERTAWIKTRVLPGRIAMRDQYASDISDYLKFSFLRTVAQRDRRLGVAWYYLPGHDGRADGRHVEYKTERGWRALDPQIYDQLVGLAEPSVDAIENLSIWPDRMLFHRTPVVARKRSIWVDEMVAAMDDADLVFLDPDNGLGKGASKHARIEDLVALRRDNRAIAIIKFPGRHKTHDEQIRELHQQLVTNGFRDAITVNTCVRVSDGSGKWLPRHRFFTIADPGDSIRTRASAFIERLNGLDDATRVHAVLIT